MEVPICWVQVTLVVTVGGTCHRGGKGSMTRTMRCDGICLAFPSYQVSVDIFKGFPDEESIVNYTLNQAYQDNVTVFASTSLGNQLLCRGPCSHV